MRREAELQKAILAFLGAHRILAFRSNTGAFAGEYKGKRRFVRFGEKGMPDITAVLPGGRALFIEVKAPGGKLSPWQQGQIARLEQQGALVFVARSIPEVADYLAKASVGQPAPATALRATAPAYSATRR